MIDFDLLHFLRPLWLLAWPVLLLLWWWVRRREQVMARLDSLVAPHLRDALTMNRERARGLRPVDVTILALGTAATAAAGPTWSQQASPWFAETAPLVVALEVSDSMRSNDLLPTRLDRARFKLLDLVAARTGSRTALIAYAGSAHVVMPPTKDGDVIKTFLESLDPAIMPEPGGNAASVLPLAQELFSDQAAVGTLLFVNDGFDAADTEALAEFSREPGTPAMAALVVGTDEGGVALLPDGSPVMDPGGGRLDTAVQTAVLRRVANEADITIVRAATGDGDVRQLLRTIQSNLRQSDDPNARWLDQAWLVLWPAALLVLLAFRRGWTMQW